jgi:hypothetical protein
MWVTEAGELIELGREPESVDRTGRASAPARKFGAQVMVAKGAAKLARAHPPVQPIST